MRSGKEQELSKCMLEQGGSAVPHLKLNHCGGDCRGDKDARVSTSLEHWEAQSDDKAVRSRPSAFADGDGRGLSRTCRYSIIVGSAIIMLVVILCLVLVLPRSAQKSSKHDISSKLRASTESRAFTSRQIHRQPSSFLEVHIPQNDTSVTQLNDFPVRLLLDSSPSVLLACTATRFPDVCQTSLASIPSANTATSVTSVADSAMELSHTEVLSLGELSRNLLSLSNNINFTDAAKDCIYLLERAAGFIERTRAIPLATKLTWQVADAQAWISAALTYENDCWSALSYVNTSRAVDEFMQKLLYSISLTSNALCMVDAYRAYGNSAHLWAPPTRLTVYDAVESPSEATAREWWQEPAVTVALDGSGDFSSLQAAIDAAPEGLSNWHAIHVRAGVYREIVRIPSTKTRIAFIGDGMGRTIITGNLNAQLPGVTTYDTATVAVDSDWFVAVGVTFENTAGPEKHQAVALRVDSDFSAFYNCSFLGFQDTLYVHSLRQFFKSCLIEGTIDFVFGNGAAFFQDCTILFRPGLPNVGTSVVAAEGRTDPGETTGIVFHTCILDGTAAFFQNTPKGHRSYLGRPWKRFSRSIFLKSVMAGFFQRQGWLPWNGNFALDTLFYGEYLSSGPGGQSAGRVPWSTQLSPEMALFFTVVPFIQGDRWLPATGVPFSASL